jgi:hypothetical protein
VRDICANGEGGRGSVRAAVARGKAHGPNCAGEGAAPSAPLFPWESARAKLRGGGRGSVRAVVPVGKRAGQIARDRARASLCLFLRVENVLSAL